MKPFVIESYKLERKNLVVKTVEGKSVTFKIYPKEEHTKESHYTKYIPERNEYAIFTRDYDEIIKGNINELIEARTLHEATHYDKRVISPAYSTGWIFKDVYVEIISEKFNLKEFKEFEKLFNFIISLDNWIEDLFSMRVLVNFFDEKVIKEAVDTKGEILKLFNFAQEDLLPFISSIGSIKKTLLQVLRTELKKSLKSFENFEPSPLGKEANDQAVITRINEVYSLYLLFDISVSLALLVLSNESTKIEKFLKIYNEPSKIALYVHEIQDILVNYYSSMNPAIYAMAKLLNESDHFWKLRWFLELNRFVKGRLEMESWKTLLDICFDENSYLDDLTDIFGWFVDGLVNESR